MNLGLTREDYDKLVKELQEGKERLFEIAFRELVKSGIAKLKERSNGENDFIEDVVMETLLFLRKRIIGGKVKYGALEFLFNKVLFQKYSTFKRKNINSISLDESKSLKLIPDERWATYDEEQYKILNVAFERLDKKCFVILKEIYFANKKFSEIALMLNVSENVVRKRKQRCLEKLKIVLNNNLNFFE